MPIQRCRKDGKPGYQWGDGGTCYSYEPGDTASRNRAYGKAEAQMLAARAAGYRGKNSANLNCSETELVTSFDKSPKKCCAENYLSWQTIGEGQKLKCEICGNLFTSVRIEKGSFISSPYLDVCAYFLRKSVFTTRTDVDKWLSNNPANTRWMFAPSPTGGKSVEVDLVVETTHGWVVVIRPYEWFAKGSLKGKWQSIGIVTVIGNLREDVDNRIPTDEEMRKTAEFVERI